jgi:hypothetical protein
VFLQRGQQKALTRILEMIFKGQILGLHSCLCDVKSHLAQGKQILIDEKAFPRGAVVKLLQGIENFSANQD